MNYSEDELEELDDNGGYIDPEFVAEHSPEITPEMKYENITEMKVGSEVSGTAGTDEILYYIKAAKTQSIVLVLQANGNIQVRINEHAVNFTENEDGTRSYEVKVQYNETYIIGISGQGTFKLSAEVKAVEETEEPEETDEVIDEVEEQTEVPATEGETAEEVTETAEEITETTEANENTESSANPNEEPAQTTDEVISTESEVPAESSEVGTVETEQTEVENTENAQETSTETGENTAEVVTDGSENTEHFEEKPAEESKPAINTWVTASYNEEEGTITVYANADIELDNQIVWQTRSADSEEWKKAGYGLKLTVEVTEENADNFFRFRLADGEYSAEYQIHATTKAAEEETEEATEEIPAEDETEEAADSEETEEDTASVENAEEETVGETTEETTEEADAEEVIESEVETVSEETVETEEEAEETAAETEVTDEETETEEETAEDTESEEEAEETEEEETTEEETEEETAEEAEPLTEEQLIELGYRKVQIMNQNGTNLYDNTTEDAAMIGTAETGTELWIKDAEAEGWAQIYTEDETQVFLKLPEIEKQKPTDEEMLAKGYVKVFVGIDIGANVYNSIDADDAFDHLDTAAEMWVQLVNGENRAAIISLEDENIIGYINLVDIIATKKPEEMKELPTRELVLHSNLEDSMVTKLFVGAELELWTELINFMEDDQYEVSWQYSADGEEFIDIPDANKLEYAVTIDMENGNYIWKVIVKLISPK